MDLEGKLLSRSVMTIGERAAARTRADAFATADSAAKWLLVGAMVVVLFAALFGSAAPVFPMVTTFVYAVASGVCLARHRASARAVSRFLLLPLFAVMIGCLPMMLQAPARARFVSCLVLSFFVFPVVVDLIMRRASPMLAGLLAVSTGVGCFASLGIGMEVSFFLIPAFVVTSGFAIARCSGVGAGASGRLVFAGTIGFSIAWLGLYLQCTHLWNVPSSERSQWLVDYPRDDPHFQTLMIAGFPIQQVQGHGHGGAREYLPWGKGLGALLANYAICTGAVLLSTIRVPVRSLILATAGGLVFSILAGWIGWWQLMVMLD